MPDRAPPKPPRRPSPWRELRENLELYEDLVRTLAHETGPLVRGSLGVRWRKCGRANCHCARGELHPARYLSAVVDGRSRQVHVRLEDERRLRRAVARYRRFREALDLLRELHRAQVEALEGLCERLAQAYGARSGTKTAPSPSDGLGRASAR